MKASQIVLIFTLLVAFFGFTNCTNSLSPEPTDKVVSDNARYTSPYLLYYKTIRTTNEIWGSMRARIDGEFDAPESTDFYCIGHLLMRSAHSGNMTVVLPVDPTTIAYPVDYTFIWWDKGAFPLNSDGAVWHPIAPAGYVAMGDIATCGYNKPSLRAMVCIRSDLVTACPIGNEVWNDKGSGARLDFSGWDAGYGLFIGNNSYTKPNGTAYRFKSNVTLQMLQ